MRRPLLLLLFAATALSAFSCKREAPPAPAAVEDETTPQDGGTIIRRLSGDVSTMNPIMSGSRYERLVDYFVFWPLLHLDANLLPAPGIAEKWEITPDGKRYTFHLNPKATFSDGTPVKASDVLYTIRKIVDPASEAAQLAGGFDMIDMPNTKVIDDHTIVVAFKNVLASQLFQFNQVMVIPEHVYTTRDFKTGWVNDGVGAGPYRIVRRVPGKEIVLERRDDWWGVKPPLQTVIFKVINDDKTAWAAMERGDIDETSISSDVWYMESRKPDLQRRIDFRRFYTLNYNFIPWNCRNPILADKRVRRALAMCIDLQSVINNLYHGTARAMNGPFTPDEWAYNPDVPVVQYNPQEAQRILTSIGWLDTDGDGVLDKGGKPFKFDMLVNSGSSTAIPFIVPLQQELKKIGVQMNIVTLDPATFLQRFLAGNFDAAYLGWDLDPDPDPFPLFYSTQTPPHGQNTVFYSNPEVDRLIMAERTQLDLNKRIPIFRQLHAILADDQPYTWAMQVSTKWAVSKRIRGIADSKGWGPNLWYPGEFAWWIPKRLRTHGR